MRIVDTSVLLPAVSPSLPQHEASRTALEAAINDERPLGLTWVVVNAFLRLTTKPGLFERPLTIDAAWDLVDDWLAHDASPFVSSCGRGSAAASTPASAANSAPTAKAAW